MWPMNHIILCLSPDTMLHYIDGWLTQLWHHSHTPSPPYIRPTSQLHKLTSYRLNQMHNTVTSEKVYLRQSPLLCPNAPVIAAAVYLAPLHRPYVSTRTHRYMMETQSFPEPHQIISDAAHDLIATWLSHDTSQMSLSVHVWPADHILCRGFNSRVKTHGERGFRPHL